MNELIETFSNTSEFCNRDINKFTLTLRKGVYPYEYMDSWERFNELSLPDKKSLCSELISENINDKDCIHAQRVFKEFQLKNLGEYHNFLSKEWCIKSDVLLLADVFENFRKMSLEIFELDPVKFILAPRLAWQVPLNKSQVK